MTTPAPPQQGLTYKEALAIAAGVQAARTPASTVQTVTAQMAEQVIVLREQMTQWALAAVTALFRSTDPFDGAQVQRFTELAGQRMVTAQTRVARAAGAAQMAQLQTMGVRVTGTPSNPVDVRAPAVDIVDGVARLERPDSVTVDYQDAKGDRVVDLDDMTTRGMFNRPARAYRFERGRGADDEAAFQAAVDRMSSLVDGNLMLAQRLAEAEMLAQAAGKDDRVIGLRRVLHPELSRTGSCGLCIAASDRIYQVTELMPIHNHCKCTAAAVTEEFDPADVLNGVDLSALYGDAGGNTAAELKRTRYQVDEHGELGPVLVPAKRHKPRKQFVQQKRRAVSIRDALNAR